MRNKRKNGTSSTKEDPTTRRRKAKDLRTIRQRKKPGQGSADVVGFRFTNVDPNKVSVRLQNHLQWNKESCSTKSKSVAKRLVNDHSAILI